MSDDCRNETDGSEGQMAAKRFAVRLALGAIRDAVQVPMTDSERAAIHEITTAIRGLVPGPVGF